MSVTLSFIDEKQFLTMIQPVLPLHECVDHAPAEFAAKPFHSIADSATTEEVAADPAAVESTIELLHFATRRASSGAALTETFCLCV
jgi:hypothetical protein